MGVEVPRRGHARALCRNPRIACLWLAQGSYAAQDHEWDEDVPLVAYPLSLAVPDETDDRPESALESLR